MDFPSWRFAGGLGASLLFLAASARPASAQLLGPEFQVNSYTTFDQGHAAVAADDTGNFVVVWQSRGQDGDYFGIFGQRFEATGIPLGAEFGINTYTTNGQSTPSVAVRGSGDFVVVWESGGQAGWYQGIFGQRFDALGAPLEGEFQVNTYTETHELEPKVAADDAGSFLAVWTGTFQDGSESGVYGRRFGATGLPAGGEFRVNSYTADYQYDAVAASLGSGNFVVVWQSHGQDGSGSGIFGQRFNAAGLSLGTELQVNSYTTADQFGPAVAADGSGGFVVVWESWSPDGSSSTVHGQRFDPAGHPLGEEFGVGGAATSRQQQAAIAVDESGAFLVTWAGPSSDGSDWNVEAQRFDPEGRPVGSAFRVNTYTTASQLRPAVADIGAGDFVVVWESELQDGYWHGVFGQRVTGPLFYDGFEAGDACAWSLVVGGGSCTRRRP